MKRPLVTGTIISLAVTAAWSYMADLAIGPAGPVNLSLQHPVASYMALAAAPTGNGWELFAVVALIFGACFLVSGRRWARRAGGDDGGL